MDSICVYCGSNPGRDPEHVRRAEALGELLARRGITTVYGGAGIGTMGALARSALDAGGEVVGVIPEHLVEVELAPDDLTALHRVDTMHQRKSLMAELAEGFIALPGGLGTLEETAEVATWSQLGLHAKPIGLLNTHGFYDHLLSFLDNAVTEQFLRQPHRDIVLSADDPGELVDLMSSWTANNVPKWFDHESRA